MATKHPSTRVSSGEVIGRSSEGIDRYLGIPFAAPPWGDLRFTLPAPAAAWSEPRECTEFGATSPQVPYQGRVGQILAPIDIAGEDMLTVNVWAPQDASDLPVVLWLHGGAFERGGAAIDTYDGTQFARDGVVFASINYRLGAEGFSVLDGAPKNLGLEDAAAGLRWVHKEIAAFGGDPSRITIMGESAGAQLVAGILARPEVGLVAGAIMQSGPVTAQPEEKARKLSEVQAKALGVTRTREGFSQVKPQDILRVRSEQMKGKTILSGEPSYVYCLDSESLPVTPLEGARRANLPLLIGANTEEHRLFFEEKDAEMGGFKLWLISRVLKMPKGVIKAYRKAWPGKANAEVFGQMLTDQVFRAPTVQLGRERKAPTYVYEFAWKSPRHNLGAAHAVEIGFVFDALASAGSENIAGAAPQGLADLMHGEWVKFIKEGRTSWPAFAEGGQVQIFDEDPRVTDVPRVEALNTMLG